MFGKKKSEVEFKGVSVSSDKRNAIILFIVEAIVVLLFIAGVLFILNYVGIISLSSINSTLFKWLPVNEVIQTNDKVEIVSEIPGYSVTITDREKLEELLNSREVFRSSYPTSIYSEGTLDNQPIEKIVLHLTDKVQQANRYSSDGGKTFYMSSYANLSSGKMDIYIHLDKSFLQNKSEEQIQSLILLQVITILYKMTAEVTTPQQIQARDAEISDTYYSLQEDSENYFNVRKE